MYAELLENTRMRSASGFKVARTGCAAAYTLRKVSNIIVFQHTNPTQLSILIFTHHPARSARTESVRRTKGNAGDLYIFIHVPTI